MMLPDISIRRPVLATVMSLMLILIGIISYTRLAVREYPNIDPPIVSVRTVYTGASAEVVESQITQPLEDSLAGIEGIKVIKSVSREEVSQVTVEFTLAREIDAAACRHERLQRAPEDPQKCEAPEDAGARKDFEVHVVAVEPRVCVGDAEVIAIVEPEIVGADARNGMRR